MPPDDKPKKESIKERLKGKKKDEIEFILDILDELDEAIVKARTAVIEATGNLGDAIGKGKQEDINKTRKERKDKKEVLSFLKQEKREIIKKAKWDFPKEFKKLSFKY